MTSALALFGNQSFFHAVSQVTNDTAPLVLDIICQLDVIPFTQISSMLSGSLRSGSTGAICDYNIYQSMIKYNNRENAYIYQELMASAFDLVTILNNTSFGTTPLSMAMYFAHEGLLTSTASGTMSLGDSRRIYYSGGALLTKPKWSLAAIVTVSVLISIQILSLCALMAYTFFHPRWTDTLDAFAMVRVGAQLQRSGRVDLPGIRDTDGLDLRPLKDVDGLIGVVPEGSTPRTDGEARNTSNEEPPSESPEVKKKSSDPRARKDKLTPPFEMAVGAPGLVTRDLARKKKKTSSADTNV